MPTVLLVEDDAGVRAALRDALRFSGFQVLEAADGKVGLEHALRAGTDLVLLDLGLPKLDGFAVLEALRQRKPGLPVIVLSARGAEEDRLRGLRRGADDYVVKPCSTAELVARVEAVLRRSAERPCGLQKMEIAGRTVDFARREVRLSDGTLVQLSEREAGLLEHLAHNRGRAIARDELLRCVWGVDPRGTHTRAIDMAVTRLRECLGDDPSSPRVILTVRAKGYMLGE